MYLNGHGVDEDIEKAEMLFKFAQDRGEPDSECAMELLASKRLQKESALDSSVCSAEGTEV
jgi:TPR repeat protein